LSRQSVAMTQNGTSTLEAQAHVTQEIVTVAGEMDQVMQQMEREEQRLLEIRTARKASSERLAAISLGLTFLVAGLLFVLDYRSLNRELDARQVAQESLRKLSARLLHLQDEERRKFSRELHDSMGQLLVSIKMHLDLLSLSNPQEASIKKCC